MFTLKTIWCLPGNFGNHVGPPQSVPIFLARFCSISLPTEPVHRFSDVQFSELNEEQVRNIGSRGGIGGQVAGIRGLICAC